MNVFNNNNNNNLKLNCNNAFYPSLNYLCCIEHFIFLEDHYKNSNNIHIYYKYFTDKLKYIIQILQSINLSDKGQLVLNVLNIINNIIVDLFINDSNLKKAKFIVNSVKDLIINLKNVTFNENELNENYKIININNTISKKNNSLQFKINNKISNIYTNLSCIYYKNNRFERAKLIIEESHFEELNVYNSLIVQNNLGRYYYLMNFNTFSNEIYFNLYNSCLGLYDNNFIDIEKYELIGFILTNCVLSLKAYYKETYNIFKNILGDNHYLTQNIYLKITNRFYFDNNILLKDCSIYKNILNFEICDNLTPNSLNRNNSSNNDCVGRNLNSNIKIEKYNIENFNFSISCKLPTLNLNINSGNNVKDASSIDISDNNISQIDFNTSNNLLENYNNNNNNNNNNNLMLDKSVINNSEYNENNSRLTDLNTAFTVIKEVFTALGAFKESSVLDNKINSNKTLEIKLNNIKDKKSISTYNYKELTTNILKNIELEKTNDCINNSQILIDNNKPNNLNTIKTQKKGYKKIIKNSLKNGSILSNNSMIDFYPKRKSYLTESDITDLQKEFDEEIKKENIEKLNNTYNIKDIKSKVRSKTPTLNNNISSQKRTLESMFKKAFRHKKNDGQPMLSKMITDLSENFNKTKNNDNFNVFNSSPNKLVNNTNSNIDKIKDMNNTINFSYNKSNYLTTTTNLLNNNTSNNNKTLDINSINNDLNKMSFIKPHDSYLYDKQIENFSNKIINEDEKRVFNNNANDLHKNNSFVKKIDVIFIIIN